jgi:hypothetical protein
MFSRLPRTAPFATVIVDTRCHADLAAALRNVAYFLPNWAMYIFHSAANEQFLIEALGPQHRAKLRRIVSGDLTHVDYNRLLASASFWEAIDAEKILIFQSDAFLRRSGITEFMEYDYVGAPWADPIRGSNGAVLRIGNGGLSLRNRLMSLAITKNRRWMGQNEDIYFAQHFFADRGANLPDQDAASRFSVETLYYPDPMGLHNVGPHLGAFKYAELHKVVMKKRPYELTILKASYGSPSSQVDVGEKLQALVQEDRLWIPQKANINKIFSDPDLGVAKKLSIMWRKTWRAGARTEDGNTMVEEFGNHLVHGDLDV